MHNGLLVIAALRIHNYNTYHAESLSLSHCVFTINLLRNPCYDRIDLISICDLFVILSCSGFWCGIFVMVATRISVVNASDLSSYN